MADQISTARLHTHSELDRDSMLLAFALYRHGQPVRLTDADIELIGTDEQPALTVHMRGVPGGVELVVRGPEPVGEQLNEPNRPTETGDTSCAPAAAPKASATAPTAPNPAGADTDQAASATAGDASTAADAAATEGEEDVALARALWHFQRDFAEVRAEADRLKAERRDLGRSYGRASRAIGDLRAQLERARNERDDYKHWLNQQHDELDLARRDADQLRTQRDEARAECARLNGEVATRTPLDETFGPDRTPCGWQDAHEPHTWPRPTTWAGLEPDDLHCPGRGPLPYAADVDEVIRRGVLGPRAGELNQPTPPPPPREEP